MLNSVGVRFMLSLLLALMICCVSVPATSLVPIPKPATLRREVFTPTYILLQVGDDRVVIDPCQLPSLLSTEPQVSPRVPAGWGQVTWLKLSDLNV
jgi:hypothetical protein